MGKKKLILKYILKGMVSILCFGIGMLCLLLAMGNPSPEYSSFIDIGLHLIFAVLAVFFFVPLQFLIWKGKKGWIEFWEPSIIS